MKNKKIIFYSGEESRLPFFFRFFQKRELINIEEDQDQQEEAFDHFPMYGSKLSKCSLPMKPISKMMNYEDQKKI